MAVNFKVPASPKRNISASDTFMGVDLTNTAVDMEGTRSPNAENMVRHVPGKVRKRMGYYKDILFGKKTNVNFAKGTSAKETEIVITTATADTWVKIYDTIQSLSVGSSTPLYLEFDYKAQDTFNVINSSVEVTASEDWEHISTTVYFSEDTAITEINVFSAEAQEIYIKNFSVMLERGETYSWSPAPNYFVERESNDPVYGCHILRKNSVTEGDNVLNVNRALNTSDEYVEYEVFYDTATVLYELGEMLSDGETIHVDFDYSGGAVQGSLRLRVAGQFVGILENTSGAHFSKTITIQRQNAPNRNVEKQNVELYLFQGTSMGAVAEIKNFAITYEKSDDYVWSPAPEDNGGTFDFKELYDIRQKNYSAALSFSDTSASSFSSTYTASCQIYNQTDFIKNGGYVSFTITTSTTNSVLSNVEITINAYGNSNIELYKFQSNSHLTSKHFDLFLNSESGGYAHSRSGYIKVKYTVTGSTKATTTITNIKWQNYSLRTIFYNSTKYYLYHVGKDIYLNAHGSSLFTKMYSDANEHISRSWQLNNKSYIIDGKDIYYYTIEEGEEFAVIGQDNAYIPVVTEAKEPSGGGTAFEALNMLQPGFIETFYGKSSVTEFQLSFNGLDETRCVAWLLNSSGNWVVKAENTDFTVNRGTGKVTFTTAPGVTPLDGTPNVKIQAYRTVEGYADRINKCTFGTLFGVAGACDRIFLSGNSEYPNWDFYSGYKDATYFPDTAYSALGSEQSRIMGYAIVNNYLTTFKDGFDMSQSVFVREGDLMKTGEEEKETSEPVFKLINTLQGEGVLAPYTFGYLQTEPLFLTKAGIYAITEQDITGEKYTQNRSFYLDGKLRKEPNLENAIATVYDNQYVLAVNNQLYILDGLQATRTDKSEPYATRQYAAFHCKDIPATYIWTDDALCFGTADGKVCRFYTDEEALASYNDDGKPIYACWETPDLDGQLFYKNKTFRYFAVRLMKAIKTSVRLYSKKLGIWTLNDDEAWTFIKEQTAIANALNFESVDFDMFTFSVDTSEKVVHTKLRVKKVDKARFRVENDALNEPFGISDIALEYIESGNYKG